MLHPETTNLDMEGVMTDYSIFVLFFLLLPVLAQIIFPLLILIIYGIVLTVRTVFGHQEVAGGINSHEKAGQEMQLSRS